MAIAKFACNDDEKKADVRIARRHTPVVAGLAGASFAWRRCDPVSLALAD
jgi:hypothetical protein